VFDWEKVPLSLRAYVVLTTGGIVATALLASVPVVPAIFSIVTTLFWNFFLIRGVRWLWMATIVVDVLAIGFDLITDTGTWYGISIGLVSLALLVVPATRQFFQADESVAAT
jgi:hypothetical protein